MAEQRRPASRDDPFAHFEAELRAPLGEARRGSMRVERSAEQRLEEAARNLLSKALRGLEAGDEAKARRFAERALDLDRLEDQDEHPATMEVHLLLYMELVRQIHDAEDGDEAWLDHAEQVLVGLDEPASGELRRALDAMLEADASPHEARRIRRLATRGAAETSVLDAIADRDERIDGVVATLRAFLALRMPDHAKRDERRTAAVRSAAGTFDDAFEEHHLRHLRQDWRE
jgi:hypothetical protein